MSRKAAARFLHRVRCDDELQARLGPKPSVDRYYSEARSLGLEFSNDDLRGVVAAEKFLQHALSEAGLFDRLSDGSDTVDLEKAVALAREQGFECSREDLHHVLTSLSEELSDGELSDDELENVAGGRTAQFTTSKTIDAIKIPAPPAPFAPAPFPNGG